MRQVTDVREWQDRLYALMCKFGDYCAAHGLRYQLFGGTLLGAGGLIRAYAQGCKAALDAARVVVIHKTHRYLFDADYAMVGKLDYFLKFQPVRVNARDFAASVTYDVSVKQEDAPAFLAGLVEASLGRVEPLLLEEDYGPWDEADASATGAEKE